MRKIRFYQPKIVSTHEEIVEFDDEATDVEIDECFADWLNNFDGSWSDVEETQSKRVKG